MPDNNEEEVSVGSPAPAFQLPASTGGEVVLAQYQGKKAVVLFFVREYN
jgi:peroxiredoxin